MTTIPNQTLHFTTYSTPLPFRFPLEWLRSQGKGPWDDQLFTICGVGIVFLLSWGLGVYFRSVLRRRRSQGMLNGEAGGSGDEESFSRKLEDADLIFSLFFYPVLVYLSVVAALDLGWSVEDRWERYTLESYWYVACQLPAVLSYLTGCFNYLSVEC